MSIRIRWDISRTMKNSCPSWIRFGKPLTTHLSPAEGLFVSSAMSACPAERTTASTWWFRCMLRYKSTAGQLATIILRPSSGTRLRMPFMRQAETAAVSLGKPYEPNAVIKNDIEFILMERKPGGYRSPSLATRILSVIPAERHKVWFQQIWTGVTGASTKSHPAPYPPELAERLVRMFSFVGDTVLDPFFGHGNHQCRGGKVGPEQHRCRSGPALFPNGGETRQP